jgi:hypothetical protein
MALVGSLVFCNIRESGLVWRPRQKAKKFPGQCDRWFSPWIYLAHNDYVEEVAGTVLAGAILILSTLALFPPCLRDLRHRLRSEGGWKRLGGCCGLLVRSFFDYNSHIPANAAWFAVLAGVATAGDDRPKVGSRLLYVNGRGRAISLALFDAL